jgi:hypothetical protein
MILYFLQIRIRLLQLTLWLSCSAPLIVSAQVTEVPLEGNYLEVGIGYQLQRFKDTRYSSIYRNTEGLSFNLSYRAANENQQHVVGLYYSNPKSNQDFASFAKNILGGIYYEHLRSSSKNIWLGGYFDLGAFFGSRGGEWSDPDGNFTWGAWSSIGVSANMRQRLGNGWTITPSFRLPLLAYTVRPAYAFPYPESYLTEGRFSFIEEGMAKEVIKSGKFQTLNNFMNLQVSCGIHRSFGARQHQIGIQYQAGYLFFNGVRPMADWQNQFSIASKFNLQKP